MRNISKAALALIAVLAAGCTSGGGSGIVVGFLVDGRTGVRLNLFEKSGTQANLTDTPDSTKQVYAVINGQFVRAKPCGAGFINDKNKAQADGCFQIPGVPYGEEVPVFAVFDGYEKFHGLVEYPAPLSSDSNGTPQIVANIRLFPKDYTVPYRLMVHLNGRPVNGVTVACQIRQGSVALKTDGQFISPLNTVSQTISAVSGPNDVYGDGYVELAGSELVLGATYACTAFQKETYEGRGVLSGTLDFVAGVDAPEIGFAVKATNAVDTDLIYAVYSNADDPTDLLTATGKLMVTFNRPVEVVPSTSDCQTYSIDAVNFSGDGSQPPAPPVDVPRSGGSEQVRVTLSADGLQMTVSFNTPSPSFDKNNWNASVSFAGIYVRPKGDGKIDGSVTRYIGRPGTNGCYAASAMTDAKALKNARTEGNQTSTINLF